MDDKQFYHLIDLLIKPNENSAVQNLRLIMIHI